MNRSVSQDTANPRSFYPFCIPITTRWMDNDVYGHVNNVIYYAWMDTIVNQWLLEHELLKSAKNPSMGLVVHSECNYFSPIAYPQAVIAGLKVVHVGNSSVRYDIGIFLSEKEQPSAQGQFVHVYVDPVSLRPHALSDAFKQTLQALR
jgi:acyl-CoA thioester hydrolase